MIHQMDQRSKCSQTQIENLRRERQELSEVLCDSSEHLIYNLKWMGNVRMFAFNCRLNESMST